MKKILLVFAMVVASVFLAQPTIAAEGDSKVVVCKFVDTPGGELDHIIIVSAQSLEGDGFNGTFPFEFGDQHLSVAVRYATAGEQAKDVPVADCNAKAPPKDTPEEPSEGPGTSPAEDTDDTLPATGGLPLWVLLLAGPMTAGGLIVLRRRQSS